METNLENFNVKNSLSPPSENFDTHEEHENTTDNVKEENSNSLELAKLKKVEMKLTKIEESKLLDKNENSIDDCSKFLDELINNVGDDINKNSPIVNSTLSPDYFPSPTSTTPANDIITQSPGPSSKPFTQSFIKPHPNGNLPKCSGKPMLSDLKRLKQRGRPKAKAVVYQSQISDNANGIKLCIKKSETPIKLMPSPNNKAPRKRSKKTKVKIEESDSDDGYVKRRKRTNNSSGDKSKTDKEDGPIEQSVWGDRIPKEILFEIFNLATMEDGCFPLMVKVGKVCRLWREVSLDKRLWHTLDLNHFKERNKTEERLKWFIDVRMLGCKDVNIANWKITNVQCVLDRLLEKCPELVSMGLAGWRALCATHLQFIAENFKKLERIDLSSICVEMGSTRSAVTLMSLTTFIEIVKERLTHLSLAHNRLAGIPQLTTALTSYSPNLVLLDLSNVKTIAVSHGVLHIEKLQHGCQKLKILRIANSHITLSTASLQEQMNSPGFPDLEELSVASLADESRLISDESLQRILKTSTKLKLLDVRGCARLTHDSLIRLPAWDLKHLFLSGCSVTRDIGSGLELIASKWAHSLIEFDLAWANVQGPLDNALRVLADKRDESHLNHLNLCGSAVSSEAVKDVLLHCPRLISINLSSCRGLPRGIKRLIEGDAALNELRESLTSAKQE